MALAFTDASIAAHQPPAPYEWEAEITDLDIAVQALLELKRAVFRDDPVREHLLMARHLERLRLIKRRMDALCI